MIATCIFLYVVLGGIISGLLLGREVVAGRLSLSESNIFVGILLFWLMWPIFLGVWLVELNWGRRPK